MSGHWIAVACEEHVARGRAQGFMQVCHGKGGPLRRVKPGDTVIYYSPTQRMGEGPPLQAFTAIGVVQEGVPYEHDMGGGFVPWRRDVRYAEAQPASIRPLLDRLSFTQGERQWGARFRYGLLAVTDADARLIADAMHAEPGA